MAKYWKLRIELTKEQHDALKKTVRSGVGGAMEIRRANVLLLADESEERKRQKDVVIANMLGITPQAVHDIKQHFLDRKAEEDPAKGIKRKKRETPPVPSKCTGDIKAKIIALACSMPPEGRGKWTLRLISERAVELWLSPPYRTRRWPRSKKNRNKPHLRKMWCIPLQQNASFVAHMEDVLEVYSRPFEQPRELHYDSCE